MREVPMSNCEKEFLLKAIGERRRLDGREIYDFRRMKIAFGIDRGCCQVELGESRVMAQVSCEVTIPKQARPSEGILFVNVELSPMAASHFEAGRLSEFGVEVNRILERCIKESRCVDTESLCIMAGLKVWSIRVDIHVLNHEGNLIDCASIAAISALAHFRRPDVSVSGEDVTIHSLEDRDPIPLSVHHMPICVTFAFFTEGKYLLVDPTSKEEKVMDGKMVIGMNKHREICTLQMTGSMLLLKDQVLRCSNIAVVKVTEITELIQKALQNDAQARAVGEKFGFAASIEPTKVTALQQESCELDMDMEDIKTVVDEIVEADSSEVEMISSEAENGSIHVLDKGTAQIGSGGPSTWDVDSASDVEEEYAAIMAEQKKHLGTKHQSENAKKQQTENAPKKQSEKGIVDLTGDLSGDSEEDDVVILEKDDLEAPKVSKMVQPVGDTIDLTMALKSKGTSSTKRKKNR